MLGRIIDSCFSVEEITLQQLCFIGGGNHLSDELEQVAFQLRHHVRASDKVLIIPFATEPDKYPRWYTTIQTVFEGLGISSVDLLTLDMHREEMIKKIEHQDVLYFVGGRPEMLLERLHTTGLTDVIRKFRGLIIGYSAGALAFCKDCIITADDYYPQTTVIKGLGLVDFSVEVHYGERIDSELFHLSDDRTIYALTNGSALFWHRNEFVFFGDIHCFQGESKKQVSVKRDLTKPLAVMMCGLAGSGKTTYAQQLQREGYFRLSIDEEVWASYGRYGVDYPPHKYSEYSIEAEQKLSCQLIELLHKGRNVVIDFSFWNRAKRDEYKRIIEQAGGEWRLVYLKVSHDILRKRLSDRSQRFDANASFPITEDILATYINGFEEPLGESEIVVEP